MRLATIALLVRDYDEAIAWFVDVLGFTLLEDTPLSAEKRWVRVGAPNGGSAILLARAADAEQRAAIGRGAGGRVSLFLETSDFWSDYHRMKAKGVAFAEEPRSELYGLVAVFRDLYGNGWDLIGPGQS